MVSCVQIACPTHIHKVIRRQKYFNGNFRQLQEAKARLQHLQDLLAAVTECHSRGQPVPDQYIEVLSQEVAREEGSDAGRGETQLSAVSRVQRHSVERERTPVKQQVYDRYNYELYFQRSKSCVIHNL
jgi:hypothetical protein